MLETLRDRSKNGEIMRIGDARASISWAWQKTWHTLGIEIIAVKMCLCFKEHMVWLNGWWWKMMISSWPYDVISWGPYSITSTQKYKCDYACSKVWVSKLIFICFYACVHVYECLGMYCMLLWEWMYRCVHICVRAKGQPYMSFSRTLHLDFWDKVLYFVLWLSN